MNIFGVETKMKVGGSALTPLLFLMGLCGTLSVGLYTAGALIPSYVALAMAVVVLIQALWTYNYLLLKDRNRLHSESHIEQMRRIDLLGDSITGPVIDGTAVTNPYNGDRDEL
jgi:hypothetical protein